MDTQKAFLLAVLFISTASADVVELAGQGFIPEPNEEVMVYVHTDASLFGMAIGIHINGDANITAAMCEADCNNYGWDNGWNSNPYIDDANDWLYISGVSWPCKATGIIGYFKFRYHSGEVVVSIIPEYSCAFDANYQSVPFSDKTLVFGEPGTQESGRAEEILSPAETSTLAVAESTFIEEKDISQSFAPVMPYTAQKQQEKLKSLKYCPPADFPEAKAEPLLTKENMGSESVLSESYGNAMPLDGGVVIVDSDITSNTVWTSDNTYHVLADINVQALLVIEPGTTIYLGYDNYAAMFINNGGTLISCGTPDNPIIYTSDSQDPWYDDYYCPIYIEETASASTKITYSYIEYAYAGIVVLNKRLDTSIENNYFYNNVFGIVEYGLDHTDITNNLFYGSWYGAIEIYMESLSGEASSDSEIYIQNNTCDYSPQWDGISVYGVPEAEDAGFVFLGNNLVSNNGRCGLVLANGYMYASVLNTGYYGNYINKNWEFEEDNPVIATQWPYEDGTGVMPWFYLKQSCPFKDAGYEYIEQTHLISKTTDVNSSPDCNKTDIGFHYPNWNFSNAGNATDLNGDLMVDFRDFAILANGWQTAYDMADLATMAGEWLQSDPNIEINIYGDSSDGFVDIGINGFTSDTQRVFLLVDGKYVGEIFGFEIGDTLTTDISESGGQEQQLKAISISNSGRVTCSNITNVAFSCPLNYCLLPSSYEPNKPLYFSALNSGIEDVSVNVYADGGNLVWSQTYSGNSIFGSIPSEITRQYEFDYISFDKVSTGLLASGSGSSILKITDPAEPPLSSDVKALIILPDWGIRFRDYRLISEVQTAFKNTGIKYKKLAGKSANYDYIASCAIIAPIKYMYVDAHGSYMLGGFLRTSVKLYDGIAVSMKKSDFAPGQAPSWCGSLGSYWETRAKSFATMGFNVLEFAYFNCCYSGKLKINANNQLVIGQSGQIGVFDGPHSDMSIALGIGETSISRVYQGWFDKNWTNFLIETDDSKFSRDEWETLGEGDNLAQAITYAISQQTEFNDPNAPVNKYRLKGQGFITDIRLSGN